MSHLPGNNNGMNALLWTTCVSLLAQAPNTVAPPQDNNTTVIWAVVLLGLAVTLFALEVFVPSGGILGGGAVASLIGGIVMLFALDTTYGLIGALLALLLLPFAFAFAIRIWPHTPIARMLTLSSPTDRPDSQSMYDENEEDGASLIDPTRTPSSRPMPELKVNASGRALTDLRPVGTCVFDGKREECLAVGSTIRAGTPVRVVAVDGMHVKVVAG